MWSFFVITMLSGYLVVTEPSAEGYINSAMRMVAIIALTTVFAYGSYAIIEVPSREVGAQNASRGSATEGWGERS